MQANVLDIQDGQIMRFKDRVHLGQRRRVCTRENAAFDPRVERLAAISADRMDQAASVGGKAAIDDVAQ